MDRRRTRPTHPREAAVITGLRVLTFVVAGALGLGIALPVADPAVAAGRPAGAVRPGEATVELDPPSPQRVYEDNPTHLTGRLTNGNRGRLVTIRVQRPGQTWHTAGTTRTDDDGAFAFDLTLVNPGPALVRAVRHAADQDRVSPSRSLQVLNRRVFLVTRPSYDTFTTIAVTGWVTPARARRHVFIQRFVHGSWVRGAGAWTDADGHYRIELRHDLPGPWAVRASWPGSRPTGGTAEYSPVHRFAVHAVLHPVVTSVTRKQLGASYHAGCPIGPPQLRNLTVTFGTFGPYVHRGTLVVRDTAVASMSAAMSVALSHGFPIHTILPTAHFDGSDVRSMYHDNTSAFNCRHVTGDPTQLSPHSYGTAVDIDPVENPYLDVHGTWWPRSKGQEFRDRGHRQPGMLYLHSAVTEAYTSRGFEWGGAWSHPDYQHFDPYGGKRAAAQGTEVGRAGAALPPAAAFGAGWRAESAWLRQPDSAGRQVLPLGCAGPVRSALPSPRLAVQATYRHPAPTGGPGRPAQAVTMRFDSPAQARLYFAGLADRLAGCSRPDGPAGLRVAVLHRAASEYVGVRSYGPAYETQRRWVEVDAVSGASVTVVLADRSLAAPLRLAGAIRAAR